MNPTKGIERIDRSGSAKMLKPRTQQRELKDTIQYATYKPKHVNPTKGIESGHIYKHVLAYKWNPTKGIERVGIRMRVTGGTGYGTQQRELKVHVKAV